MARLMSNASNVALTTPGTLEFRDMAIRVIIESCWLVMRRAMAAPQGDRRGANGQPDTAHADPAHADTAHADPAHADPAHADPAHADPAHADPMYDGFHIGTPFAEHVTAGFGEVFNNIVLHAYGGGNDEQTIHCEVTIAADRLEVMLTDNGRSFDITAVPPLEEELPQGGMGLYITRAVFDTVEYVPGPPNRWHLVRNVRPEDRVSGAPSTPAPQTEPPAQAD